jgi:glutamine synthetase
MSDEPALLEELLSCETDDEFVEAARRAPIDFIDLRFADLPGRWHHVTLPASRLESGLFRKGVGFDGSSVPGFKRLEKGDMVLIPDRSTPLLDEVGEHTILSMIASAAEADTRKPFPLDPRAIARRAEEVLRRSGHADRSLWGPELEFYVLSGVDYGTFPWGAFYEVESDETGWTPDDDPDARLGYRIPRGGGYHVIPPCDMHFDLRNEISARMEEAGIPVKYHHHENGAAGQMEIEFMPEPLTVAADHVMLGKFIARNTAFEWGVSATFMPKPLPDEAGSGLHFHVRLELEGGSVLHAEEGYAGLSREGLSFIGGILLHGRALAAVTNPSTNSYRRLRPGYEAPTNLFFSAGNRSAAIRIPQYATEPATKALEYRPSDASANPYLAMAALLAAGLDGVERGVDPKEHGLGPFDANIHDLGNGVRRQIAPLPASLEEALAELTENGGFLTESGIFPDEFVSTWVDLKSREAESVRTHPHPAEYGLYFDC